MGRPLRTAAGGLVYHVLNRANARMRIFDKQRLRCVRAYPGRGRAAREDAFVGVLVMPNHWHLVVWPREDGDLSAFVGWLTLTHTQRWHAHRHSVGSGHVYQGRFKSFLVHRTSTLDGMPVRGAECVACRLCARAEEWRWSSLRRRESGDADCRAVLVRLADCHAEGLAAACDPRRATRVGGVRRCAEPKSALRERGLGGSGDQAVWPRVGFPAPRPSLQGIRKQWFLTPFPL